MYLWNYSVPLKQRLFYTDPVLATRPAVNSGAANFGKQLMETGITADVVIPSVANACTALTAGSLTGKIAMVNTTTCAYNIKAKNVQDAGAIGMIVHRTTSNSVTDIYVANVTNVSIPSIMIPKDEGDFITSELNAGKTVNVNLKDLAVGYKNSSFDNGVMIHEYGHGVSNRLTGQGYSCLTNLEQMGEGWSDFFALMLTNTPGYTSTTGRGIGTYSTNSPTTALGIRSYRYTTDMTANPFTYADTNTTQGQAHAVGQIWATMLWDLHWKYVEKYGYSSDVTANPNSGSARVLQLVTDAMKVTACSPTFIDGRDAILQAELSTTEGTDKCMIWGVFAKRGLGVKASAGLKKSITPVNSTNMIAALNDQVEDFTYPAECSSSLTSEEVTLNKEVQIYPNPAKNEIFIKSNSLAIGETIISVYDATGKLVISEKKNLKSQNTVDTSRLSNGIYIIKGEGIGVNFSQKIIIEK